LSAITPPHSTGEKELKAKKEDETKITRQQTILRAVYSKTFSLTVPKRVE
jgi:hypothetical protein